MIPKASNRWFLAILLSAVRFGSLSVRRSVSSAISVPVVLAVMVLTMSVAPRLAFADWPRFGEGICTATGAQVHPEIASDGAGGAIITWQDFRSPPSKIAAQHVLASGERDLGWPFFGRVVDADPTALENAADGQAAPVIVPDGAGGAIIAWRDGRDSLTEHDIYAQHIRAIGKVDSLWPANGTALCVIEGLQNSPAMVSDGAGGAIVTWMDRRPGASVIDVYAQHVLASGLVDARWPANGIAVGAAPGPQEFPDIVEDGAGGAIITWDDLRGDPSGDDIYAQHVLNSGVVDPAWPVNGRAVCTASGDQGRPTLTSDGAHGAIVVWTDSRVFGTAHIFAQHVLGSGAVDSAWPANGRAISNAALLEARTRIAADGAGGAIVTWQGFTVHLNIYAQHVTAAGVVDPAWPVAGRALSNTDRLQFDAEIVPDGAGGAIVAWQDSNDVVAQHVLASGAFDPAYPDTGLSVVNLPSQQGDVHLVATGPDGAIATWTDSRSGTGPDIFAMQVLVAVTLDVTNAAPPGITFARPSPNPASGPLTLRFALPREAGVRLAIYDISGRRVRELASGAEPAGEHAITWDLRDEGGEAVGVGIYFARLEVEQRTLTQKLARLR